MFEEKQQIKCKEAEGRNYKGKCKIKSGKKYFRKGQSTIVGSLKK